MNRRASRNNGHFGWAKAGFTLVEILVATAVLAVLVVALASVLRSVTSMSAQASARLDAARLAREIFNLMGRDLSQATIPRAELGAAAPLQFVVNPSGVVDSSCMRACSIFWQSSIVRYQPGSSTAYSGNIAIVGYFVQRISPNSTRSQLRRVLINPNDPNSVNPAGTLYRIYDQPANWLQVDTINSYSAKEASAGSANLDQGWVADGVLGLWVRCLDPNGEIISKDGSASPTATPTYAFDSRKGYKSGPNPAIVASPAPSPAPGFVFSNFNALPAFVEIGLVIVAPKDVPQIDFLPGTVTATVPANMESDMNTYLTAFNANNRRVKTATALTRRFRIYGKK